MEKLPPPFQGDLIGALRLISVSVRFHVTFFDFFVAVRTAATASSAMASAATATAAIPTAAAATAAAITGFLATTTALTPAPASRRLAPSLASAVTAVLELACAAFGLASVATASGTAVATAVFSHAATASTAAFRPRVMATTATTTSVVATHATCAPAAAAAMAVVFVRVALVVGTRRAAATARNCDKYSSRRTSHAQRRGAATATARASARPAAVAVGAMTAHIDGDITAALDLLEGACDYATIPCLGRIFVSWIANVIKAPGGTFESENHPFGVGWSFESRTLR